MRFSTIPDNFSPITEPIIFGVDSDCSEAREYDIEIRELCSGKTIASFSQTFAEGADIDIAPYVRATMIDTMPLRLLRSALVEIPSACYELRVGDAVSPVVRLSQNTLNPVRPSWYSTMPTHRTITHGEQDEIRLFCDEGATLTVYLSTDMNDDRRFDIVASSGAALFVFCTQELSAEAHVADIFVSCNDEQLLHLSYAITPAIGNPYRLAWLSAEGTIERYTFPVVNEVVVSTARTSISTATGIRHKICSSATRIVLSSAYEPNGVTTALADIVRAPRVWVDDDELLPVEVVSSSITATSFGRPSRVTLELCKHYKDAR